MVLLLKLNLGNVNFFFFEIVKYIIIKKCFLQLITLFKKLKKLYSRYVLFFYLYIFIPTCIIKFDTPKFNGLPTFMYIIQTYSLKASFVVI
jgi:hypothetical protein